MPDDDDHGGGKVVRHVGLGVVHRNDRFPHLYWQNFLSVDATIELSAEVLIAEADRVFADLPIRHVRVAEAEVAERLRPGFFEGGYKEVVILTLELRRPPDREPPPADWLNSALRSSAPSSRHTCEAAPATSTPSARWQC